MQQLTLAEATNTELIPENDPRYGIVSIDRDRHSGTPCFAGTRVPIQDLWEYLAGGDSLDDFLESFPTVSRGQAIQVINLASQKLLEGLPVR